VLGDELSPPSGMSTFFASHHMPCSECGASVPDAEHDEHACEPARLLEFKVFRLREEIEGFDESLSDYLASPHGRFAQWLAERDRERRRRGRR
jgi:hypothetical protein